MISLDPHLRRPGRTVIAGAPDGYDALVLAHLARADGDVLFVARDDVSMAEKADALAFFAPDVERMEVPAWDCLPYDRVSPNAEIVGRRIDALTKLIRSGEGNRAGGRLRSQRAGARVVLTTVSALLQRVAPRLAFADAAFGVRAGDRVDPDDLVAFLLQNGYGRTETVMEPGEFAVRGGILDVFPPGGRMPLRLDFFGDELERIRVFDPESQRTSGTLDAFTVKPVSEVLLDAEAIARFRTAYRELFGVSGADDPLFESVSQGRRHMGMEHWLPLFHPGLETLFDYVAEAVVVLDHRVDEATEARLDLVAEYYAARQNLDAPGLRSAGPVYRPVPPDRLFLGPDELDARLAERSVAQLFPFDAPETVADGPVHTVDAGGRPGRDFAEARVRPGMNVFDAVGAYLAEQRSRGRRILVTSMTAGSRERLASLLADHGVEGLGTVDGWEALTALGPGAAAIAVLGLERGFVAENLAGTTLVVITEQDILGDRLTRPQRRRVKPENVIAEASALAAGDLVVHAEHGIGRFDGLHTIEAAGVPHDCLRLIYEGGDKLFVPVENIDVLSRYGSEEAGVQLDRLGSAAWQARKARMKNRIRDMAGELIRMAAARALRPGPRVTPPPGLYEEFCARFPYAETDDQIGAIEDTMRDLASGRCSDRLICGDVGFGKTEVALRAAFATVFDGKQVAVVVPTTLLCRQHQQTFMERFRDLPVRVEALSRLVPSKRAREVKAGLKAGTVDVVIGTHALLAKDIEIRDLGLLVVDEEQHFGVAHKERLKRLKADVHVLTLTATPIPRTLQLALSGIRDMSLIATPPVDRLAVRTFVLPFDPVIVREAILREQLRGGQTFYVCPRINELDRIAEQLRQLVPEIRMTVAHGRMPARELETSIAAFYDGAYDVLLSTDIIESGLDLPRVNTIVIHRADMFGLAQLYQLRGRVGRSKVRAYAYLTLPQGRMLSAAAERRLQVMQTLDMLGAGFSLASHDLDIRGAGNLLGAEQSGHIREVGIELYQQMLEEAVAEARDVDGTRPRAGDWVPQISIGIPVLIPETYVGDLGVRLGLYRRIARLDGREEIDAFAAELIDRFGPLPEAVDNLLETVAIKRLCREAGIERLEAGPKGAVVSFHNQEFANPAGLVDFITGQQGTARLKPDHRLVFMRDWETSGDRLEGTRRLLGRLARIAGAENDRATA